MALPEDLTRPHAATREHLVHMLYEAAELEHDLMCTYLYAAFSLRDEHEGLDPTQAEAVARWKHTILHVAIEEMGHLTAVWNLTAALGGAPPAGRDNFPLDPGVLPAGVVVKLAPFSAAVLQHFVYLERPHKSRELDGTGFAAEHTYRRGVTAARLTPMPLDYDTVGDFYHVLAAQLAAFAERVGDSRAFVGDPRLQLSQAEVPLAGAEPVRCLRTARAALRTIIEQGEGARADADGSHYQRFLAVRDEHARLCARDPSFEPAFPSAENPVLRRPVRPTGRVWIEDEHAARVVDLANAGYGLMLRLLSYSYLLPSPRADKAATVALSLAMMRAVTLLGEHAARLPAGPSHPGCNAGMSFTALRDAAPLLPGASARAFFVERLCELAEGARALARDDTSDRVVRAAAQLESLARRAEAALTPPAVAAQEPPAAAPSTPVAASEPAPERSFEHGQVGRVERIEGKQLTVLYEGKKCIHARFCVTGAPSVFLANVEGPWIHPDTMDVAHLVEVAHACPSGAIRYLRKDGVPDETAPPVNLLAVREAGPYAVRGALSIDGQPIGMRATLCRCGASKQKPYCDGSHHEVGFTASGEPATRHVEPLTVRDGPLAIEPETDGPLLVRGNLEITSGTGRAVARVVSARLCRCGASAQKPFCDRSHVRIGFRSA